MKVVLFVIGMFLLACQPECDIEKPNELIKDALLAGSLVTVRATNDVVEIKVDGIIMGYSETITIDGVIVGTSHRAMTTGCFGIPTCFRIDDKHRGIIKISIDDFSLYDEIEELSSSVTYGLSTSYDPIWVGNDNATAFQAVVDAHSGGAYENKRKGCCANNPDKCHCETVDTDTE